MVVPFWLLASYGFMEQIIIFLFVIKVSGLKVSLQKLLLMSLTALAGLLLVRFVFQGGLIINILSNIFFDVILIWLFTSEFKTNIIASSALAWLLTAMIETTMVFIFLPYFSHLNFYLVWILTGLPHIIILAMLTAGSDKIKSLWRNMARNHLREILLIAGLVQVLFTLTFAAFFHLSLRGDTHLMGIDVPPISQISGFLLFGSYSSALVIVYLVIYLFRMTKLENKLIQEKIQNEAAENTINLLNSHRHDYLNHLQVIMGYIQISQPDHALKYIEDISREVKELKTQSDFLLPEVAVLLYVKKLKCQEAGIHLIFENQAETVSIKIRPVDLVRILANLIDNAMFEQVNRPLSEDEKIIRVIFQNAGEHLSIKVNNTGSFIPDKNKIFQYGYTTKANRGSGIGLYGIKNLIEKKYQGTITVDSNLTEGTTFTITI